MCLRAWHMRRLGHFAVTQHLVALLLDFRVEVPARHSRAKRPGAAAGTRMRHSVPIRTRAVAPHSGRQAARRLQPAYKRCARIGCRHAPHASPACCRTANERRAACCERASTWRDAMSAARRQSFGMSRPASRDACRRPGGPPQARSAGQRRRPARVTRPRASRAARRRAPAQRRRQVARQRPGTASRGGSAAPCMCRAPRTCVWRLPSPSVPVQHHTHTPRPAPHSCLGWVLLLESVPASARDRASHGP